MESAEKIVEDYARYVKGLATIPRIRCEGQREIELIAVDPAKPMTRYHIAIGVTPPASFSGLDDESLDPSISNDADAAPKGKRGLGYFLKTKFEPVAVVKRLRELGFEDGQHRRVLVTWEPSSALVEAAVRVDIEIWSFKAIARELAQRLGGKAGQFADKASRASVKGAARPVAKPRGDKVRPDLTLLWGAKDAGAWEACAGALYDAAVKPARREIERELEKPGLRARIARMSATEFRDFLRDAYYPSIFSTKSRLDAALKALARHEAEGSMEIVERVRQRLVNRAYDGKGDAIRRLMGKHGGVHGMTMAGASGLLGWVYPDEFAVLDAVVAKALQSLGARDVDGVNPRDISFAEAEAILEILRLKALELNRAFGSIHWTTRRVGRALWAAAR